MSRTLFKLGDLLDIKHGYAFDGEFFNDDGPFVLLTPGSFNEVGGFRDQGEKTKFYTGDVPDGYILNEGALIVAMTEQAPGLLGSSALVPQDDRYLHNQRLGLVVELDESQLDRRYLYRLFNTREVRAQIAASASGTKVRHTAPSRIRDVMVDVPELSEQIRIAAVADAYDSLIENNSRRMALLEQAARLLYEEWFVRLRFPGHEHARISDGVPDGWERKKLGDVLTLKRGYDLPDTDRVDGIVPIVSSSGITGFHSEAKARAPGVVTGRYGTLGQVYFIDQNYWPLNTALYVSDFRGHPACLIAHVLTHALKAVQSDKAAVPGLNRNVAHDLTIVWPCKLLRGRFNEFAKSTQRQISVLTRMNEKLSAARDLLLPRLMSGEVAL